MGNSDPACICPPVTPYTKEFEVALAKEVAALDEKDAVVTALKDYAVVRKQLAVCQ